MENFNCVIVICLFLLTIYIYNDNSYNSYNLIHKDVKLDDYFLSHKKCPVTGGETKYSACIHYPPLNLGFTISISSKYSLSEIQKSLKKNDGKYSIYNDNGIYYFKGRLNNQIVKLCNKETIQELLNNIGTNKTLN